MSKLFKSIIAVLSFVQAISLRPGADLSAQEVLPVPRRAIMGAYDSGRLNGIVLIVNERNIFGLRFLTYRAGDAVEDAPQSYELGDCAPDGSFARLSWRSRFDDKNPLTLRWSRISDNAIIGQLSAPSDIRVAIEAYRPWSELRADLGWTAFSAQDDHRTIFGEEVNSQKAGAPLRNFLLQTDRVGSGAAEYSDPQSMRAIFLREGYAKQPESSSARRDVDRFSVLSFDSVRGAPSVPPGASTYSIGFVAMIGDDFGAMQAESNNLLQKLAAGILEQEEKRYEDSRPASGGALGSFFTVLNRALNWSRIYLPEKRFDYIAFGRRDGRDPPSAPLSWNTFFNAVVSSKVNDASSMATIRLLLDGLTSDGRLPLRRYLRNPQNDETMATAGRSMPPIGALCVWKVYILTRDLEFLAWTYPRLRQWNDWRLANRGDGQAWRDGDGDGLLEWGFDAELELGRLGARAMSKAGKRRLAFSESGLEDRPQWLSGATAPAAQPNPSVERPSVGPPSVGRPSVGQPSVGWEDEARYNDQTHTLEYSTVGLNALYALDTEMLMIMANELGLQAEADRWRTRYDQIRKNVNEKLWSEEDGLYLNRHWDGRFSRRLSPENFYPLAAGLADKERAKRMIATLLDPKKFWGEYPLPAISRDDPAFAAGAPGRGAIWAPMNYLVYLGLKRYGYHAEAAELARKSLAIGRSALEKSGYDDHISSVDGKPVDERSGAEGDWQRTYFFGLMTWPAVEEAFNTDPWAGLSFGSVAATEESQLERLDVSGAKLDVITGPKRTVIRRNGAIEVECETPVRLRAYHSSDRTIGFVIEAIERAHITIPASKGRKITVSVDDKVLGSAAAGAAASFKVSAGTHKVLIVK